MPYPGEHAARITDPDQYDRMRRQNNKFGRGVHVIYGVKNDTAEVQAIRFDKDVFTVEEARKWLADHDYKPIRFEPAASEREEAEYKPFRRLLSFDLTSIKPGGLEKVDGGLLAKGVKVLAEGEWTDSAMRTPLFYPSRTLEKYATNWRDNSVWSRHAGGSPRSITDKIGRVLNHRFEDAAVKGDIFWHGLTSQSKDAIALVKAGEINYVSVEHGGEERYNPETKRMEAETLTFLGLATVNRGACEACRIRASEATDNPPAEPEESEMEIKELEAKLAQLEVKNKELEAKIAAPAPKIEVPKELSDSMAALAARIEKMEKQPAPPAVIPAVKELEEPPRRVIINNRGEVHGA